MSLLSATCVAFYDPDKTNGWPTAEMPPSIRMNLRINQSDYMSALHFQLEGLRGHFKNPSFSWPILPTWLGGTSSDMRNTKLSRYSVLILAPGTYHQLVMLP